MAISKILRSMFPIATKRWTGASLALNAWYVGATITIPAGARALVFAYTSNGNGSKINNACNFNLSSGTATQSLLGPCSNDAGSGNSAIGWAYIEAETACTLQVRQYGYTQAISGTASGVVLVLTLAGDQATIS